MLVPPEFLLFSHSPFFLEDHIQSWGCSDPASADDSQISVQLGCFFCASGPYWASQIGRPMCSSALLWYKSELIFSFKPSLSILVFPVSENGSYILPFAQARNLSVILGSLLPFPHSQSPNSVNSTTRISEVLLCQFYHLNIQNAFMSARDCRHLPTAFLVTDLTSLTIGVTMSLRQCSYLSKGRGTLATELSPDIST